MKKVIVSLFILGLSLSGWSQSFDEKVTTSSRVRLNVTNVGTFGNAFRGYRDGSGTPSCEYPAGSGIEHLFESGIWIAANPDQVSTAAYDAPNGYATGGQGFEMTVPVGSVLNEKSTLFDVPITQLTLFHNKTLSLILLTAMLWFPARTRLFQITTIRLMLAFTWKLTTGITLLATFS